MNPTPAFHRITTSTVRGFQPHDLDGSCIRRRPHRQHPFLYFLFLLPLLLASCGTTAPRVNYQELAHAAITLEMDIDLKDNHALYVESARWIGTPYRGGGHSRKGTDCSGLTSEIYKKVYRKKLERSADGQRKKNCERISKGKLREGDLVFFHNGRKKRVASHVGLYLKNRRFIHASTSKGVIVSSLDEPYYRQRWLSGGRPKR